MLQSAFNKSLSQKMRHIRLNMRKKSLQLSSNEPLPKKPCFRTRECDGSEAQSTTLTAEDTERHVAEIKKEWEKAGPNRNQKHIKQLLKATLTDRKRAIADQASGSMGRVYERYPCFEDANMVTNTKHIYVEYVRSVIIISERELMVTLNDVEWRNGRYIALFY